MKGRFYTGPFLVALVLSLCGCSVKEDRTLAPTDFRLDAREYIPKAGEIGVSLYRKADGAETNTAVADHQKMAEPFRVEKVMKGDYLWAVWDRGSGVRPDGAVLVYPETVDRMIWASGGFVSAMLERTDVTARPHRQCSTLHVRVNSPKMSIAGREMTLVSTARGLDLRSMEAVSGRKETKVTVGPDHCFTVMLPRQCDYLQVLTMTADGGYDIDLDLGGALYDAGFSWFEDDLSDVDVTVDLRSLEVRVDVKPWISGYEREHDFFQ